MKREAITQTLLERINNGAYNDSGGFLPPERLLAEEFGVSRPTLRRALLPLVESGQLKKRRGVGMRLDTPLEREDRGRVVALLVPDVTNPFHMEMVESIEHVAMQHDCLLLLANSRNQLVLEEKRIRQFANAKVDGVLFAHPPGKSVPNSIGSLNTAQIPVVLLFSTDDRVLCDTVLCNEGIGVSQVLRYLFSLQHRHVAYCRPLPGSGSHPREEAFVQEMRGSGCDIPPHFLIDFESLDDSNCRSTLQQLLAQNPSPTALFAGNDRLAMVILKHLAAMGIRVPQDLSLVGHGNTRMAAELSVPLTSVDQPKTEMGRCAIEFLLERMDGTAPLEPRVQTYEPRLVIRDSCAVAPRG